MASRIIRRDFLDGARIAVTGATLAPWLACLAESEVPTAPGDPYPPAGVGTRGSHAGSFEVAHALVAGQHFDRTGTATGERYDLAVVGAGISGLTAAYLYRQAKPDARILLLEDHEDFGGHSRRNEFFAEGIFRFLSTGEGET